MRFLEGAFFIVADWSLGEDGLRSCVKYSVRIQWGFKSLPDSTGNGFVFCGAKMLWRFGEREWRFYMSIYVFSSEMYCL